jgi:Prokaryotic E2 family D
MTTSPSAFSGLNALSAAVQAKPLMVITFYPYGILMRRAVEGGGETEYPVSAAQLASALAAKVQFSTGLLSENTLYISSEGVKKVVVDYRRAQKTALFLDGAETALHVPLPGLVLVRVTTANDNPRYGVYAVKRRPTALDADLYLCPLPNTSRDGICWGTVKKVSEQALAGNDLAEDWRLLLGTVFTNHSVNGKSHTHPLDIRQKLAELEQRKARVYPMRDLVKLDLTLAEVLERVQR